MRHVGYVLYLVIAVVLLGEAVFWILPDRSNPPPYDTASRDLKLGWKPKGNYVYDGLMESLDGEEYDVHYSTRGNGFRHFPRQRE